MNDRPPAVYTATLLWLDVLPAMAAPAVAPTDVIVTPALIAQWLRVNYGWGDAKAARRALEFLSRAGLARERSEDWIVGLKTIATKKEEVRRELADRYLSKPKGPATVRDQQEADVLQKKHQQEREENLALQEPLDLEPGEDGI